MAMRLIYDKLPAMSAALQPRARAIVQDTAQTVEKLVKNSMATAKHGRSYLRGAMKKSFSLAGGKWRDYKGMQATLHGGQVAVTVGYKFHRASAPGEAPAIDTGALVNSIHTVMQPVQATAIVFTNQDYANALEFGTARIKPRPAFQPALDQVRDEFFRKLGGLFGGV